MRDGERVLVAGGLSTMPDGHALPSHIKRWGAKDSVDGSGLGTG